MPSHLITLYRVPAVPVDFSQRNMTLRQSEVTPTVIDAYAMAKNPVTPPAVIVVRPTTDLIEATGGGVYPVVGDVDKGAKYGPTGVEYTGTLLQPAATDVKKGTQYGADGTEFTGTMTGGTGGLTTGTVLIDPVTGMQYIYVQGRIVVGLT